MRKGGGIQGRRPTKDIRKIELNANQVQKLEEDSGIKKWVEIELIFQENPERQSTDRSDGLGKYFEHVVIQVVWLHIRTTSEKIHSGIFEGDLDEERRGGGSSSRPQNDYTFGRRDVEVISKRLLRCAVTLGQQRQKRVVAGGFLHDSGPQCQVAGRRNDERVQEPQTIIVVWGGYNELFELEHIDLRILSILKDLCGAFKAIDEFEDLKVRKTCAHIEPRLHAERILCGKG